MKIDKDTAIFASFSANPGNLGCKRFNHAFEINGINAIYKSFKVDEIGEAFAAAKTLGIKGFAISAPFKTDARKYCGASLPSVNSINTAVWLSSFLGWQGFNTDILGVYDFFNWNGNRDFLNTNDIYIIGMGAFAKSIATVLNKLGTQPVFVSSRGHFPKFPKGSLVINASPLKAMAFEAPYGFSFLDAADTNSVSGKEISFFIARRQFYDVYGFPKEYKFEEVT